MNVSLNPGTSSRAVSNGEGHDSSSLVDRAVVGGLASSGVLSGSVSISAASLALVSFDTIDFLVVRPVRLIADSVFACFRVRVLVDLLTVGEGEPFSIDGAAISSRD